ncbi:DUF6615 family protein [Burkholderia theae]|uniref:DUF6615 family protein n=1 Tax=Burkholderia theae TaxID=3143496 RepID=A0ABU9WBS5_9BURK
MLSRHFEDLSEGVWDRLADSLALNISQGEETITDNLLLDLARLKHPGLSMIKTPKNLESDKGTDWEWWIGNDNDGWLRYAVQAKKLNLHELRYDTLRHVIPGKPAEFDVSGNLVSAAVAPALQHDVLRDYATGNGAIPLYAFYNHAMYPDYQDYWQCPNPLRYKLLGISVTPLSVVQHALATRGERSFERMHEKPQTIPIRCLLECPRIAAIYRGDADASFEKFGVEAHVYGREDLPVLDFDAIAPDMPRDYALGAFPAHVYNHDIAIYPKRIMFVNTRRFDDQHIGRK